MSSKRCRKCGFFLDSIGSRIENYCCLQCKKELEEIIQREQQYMSSKNDICEAKVFSPGWDEKTEPGNRCPRNGTDDLEHDGKHHVLCWVHRQAFRNIHRVIPLKLVNLED